MIKYLKPIFYFSNLSTISQFISWCLIVTSNVQRTCHCSSATPTNLLLQKAKQWSPYLSSWCRWEKVPGQLSLQFHGSSQTEASTQRKSSMVNLSSAKINKHFMKKRVNITLYIPAVLKAGTMSADWQERLLFISAPFYAHFTMMIIMMIWVLLSLLDKSYNTRP